MVQTRAQARAAKAGAVAAAIRKPHAKKRATKMSATAYVDWLSSARNAYKRVMQQVLARSNLYWAVVDYTNGNIEYGMDLLEFLLHFPLCDLAKRTLQKHVKLNDKTVFVNYDTGKNIFLVNYQSLQESWTAGMSVEMQVSYVHQLLGNLGGVHANKPQLVAGLQRLMYEDRTIPKCTLPLQLDSAVQEWVARNVPSSRMADFNAWMETARRQTVNLAAMSSDTTVCMNPGGRIVFKHLKRDGANIITPYQRVEVHTNHGYTEARAELCNSGLHFYERPIVNLKNSDILIEALVVGPYVANESKAVGQAMWYSNNVEFDKS